jgi:DNA end-binding protein Ku
MAKAKRPRGRAAAKHRASWRGLMSFGLVSFPVEAFNALDRQQSDIHFHQLHADCHSRIQHKKVCPIHGEVGNDEIISGYEYKKGKYVEVEPEELAALRSESERALKIDAFVSPEAVDPLYFDGRMYYLVPAGNAAQEPYAVIAEAMEREGRCGIGRIVLSGKDQIVLVRPVDGVLHMAMLNYEAEIRSPKTISHAIKKPPRMQRHIRLAQKLIEEWSHDSFDFSKYEDPYREKVKELIEAKVHGRDIVPTVEDNPAEVLNLMDALKKSVGATPKRPVRDKRVRRQSA